MKKVRPDAVVIGGGPAGLSAGLYLARAGWRTVLLERGALGGQARLLERVENYAGFPGGVSGRELMRRFVEQARRWRLGFVKASATRVARSGGGFRVETDAGRWTARSVVACTGAEFAPPPLKRRPARGVYHGAFGRAPRFAGRVVAVLGGGEAAAHQALQLSRHARTVYLIHRGRELKAIPLLLERLAARPNVVRLAGTALVAARSGRGGALDGVEIEDLATARRRTLAAGALFVLIGKRPRAPLCGWRRPPPGFFAAGDVTGAFRQVSVAAGDGARAAMECHGYLTRGSGSAARARRSRRCRS